MTVLSVIGSIFMFILKLYGIILLAFVLIVIAMLIFYRSVVSEMIKLSSKIAQEKFEELKEEKKENE